MHETNTFAPLKATWDDFLRPGGSPGLTQGADIWEVFPSRNSGTGGFINQAREMGHSLKPIAWCSAVPSAHVTEEAFENFSALLLSGLEQARPFDAVYLDLHGAMVLVSCMKPAWAITAIVSLLVVQRHSFVSRCRSRQTRLVQALPGP